ncbi:TetR/AcrR family transcriptional regulator [Xanthobacter autotrophicus]|uniref:TetR/AcrR family transcriptional regulator n=1 Tax=Xanthobacter autotrophicus TaxID=280 RepID=UPI001E2EC2DA|nr:TetR/AcrR family transcriptional regulator [Xanthobacter autotrophicus]UDQ90365.1 TetR/AcrR family transcriptional regulator [Xanthobacter autotrophicus]
MPASDTRAAIVAAADRLFYENGFASTSFADIAAAVKLSRGNFYYHFKSKDEILAAVIALRLERTRQMLERWEADGADAEGRILSFIGILIANRAKIMRFGCPVGTLCNELAKLDHAAGADAARLFTLFRDWLARQFRALGHSEDEAARLAMHLLARSQGVATLASSIGDDAFINAEVAEMRGFVAAHRRPAAHA